MDNISKKQLRSVRARPCSQIREGSDFSLSLFHRLKGSLVQSRADGQTPLYDGSRFPTPEEDERDGQGSQLFHRRRP